MSKTYRKKPVEIEAMQWDGRPETAHPMIQWVNGIDGATATWTEHVPFQQGGYFDGHTYVPRIAERAEGIYIRTLEGEMHVSPGDWVIRGVQGEFYPCKPDIFEATYEKVEAR
ncbi:hypothetical protein [Curtobacterium sp. VKM Ac-2884]|uniref:hypothetical protein n=1 Tax=Curtobacterium sp. VKM Ac-2884 TaxID=2783818 RepID=UPI00188A8BBB|nr:hypothetical protein [Curtobacterium sp. VKM Ac-2884]MBF4602812.1 hypothetical protein [Curtobacterium sp. VKM Ac-2884]